MKISLKTNNKQTKKMTLDEFSLYMRMNFVSSSPEHEGRKLELNGYFLSEEQPTSSLSPSLSVDIVFEEIVISSYSQGVMLQDYKGNRATIRNVKHVIVKDDDFGLYITFLCSKDYSDTETIGYTIGIFEDELKRNEC